MSLLDISWLSIGTKKILVFKDVLSVLGFKVKDTADFIR